MSVGSKVAGLLEALRGETFEGMAPTQRRQIAQLCRFIAEKADPDKPQPPKAGVLSDIRYGARAE